MKKKTLLKRQEFSLKRIPTPYITSELNQNVVFCVFLFSLKTGPKKELNMDETVPSFLSMADWGKNEVFAGSGVASSQLSCVTQVTRKECWEW